MTPTTRSSVFALLFAGLLGLAACAPTPHQGAGPADVPVRGVWLTNVDSEVLFDPDTLDAALARLAAHGFNTVFPVVWNKGFTLFPSDVMVRYFGEAFRQDSLFAAQGRDPLRELVAAGRRHGLTVVPWFEYGFAASYQRDGGHLLARYPAWAARDRDGGLLTKNGFEWMNALHPQVQDFMLALVTEVIVKYDVDGIQGDDRLPAMPSEGGYDDYTAARYERETGQAPPDDARDSTWVQWRADKLSDFGSRLYETVKSHDSTLVVSLSPSVFPWSLEEYLQDWPAWIERGQVDWLHPQVYRYDLDSYRATIDEALTHFNAAQGHEDVKLTPGLLLKAGPRFNDPAYVLDALRYHRQHGITGEVFFFYEGLWEQNGFVADSVAQHFYR